MPLTGNIVLATVTLSGRTTPDRKLKLVKGRRGPIEPGPGGALLMRCERCRWTPCEPR